MGERERLGRGGEGARDRPTRGGNAKDSAASGHDWDALHLDGRGLGKVGGGQALEQSRRQAQVAEGGKRGHGRRRV